MVGIGGGLCYLVTIGRPVHVGKFQIVWVRSSDPDLFLDSPDGTSCGEDSRGVYCFCQGGSVVQRWAPAISMGRLKVWEELPREENSRVVPPDRI